MSSVTNALRLAAVIMALVCIGHIWRVVGHLPVTIGRWVVPFWPSAVAAILSGALALWLFSLSRSS